MQPRHPYQHDPAPLAAHHRGLMDRLERVHGDRPLVSEADVGLTLTYRQAAKRVRRWAGGIAARTEKGDVVVIAGKGHETGQIVGDKVLPFSDHDEVRKALERV